MRLETSHVWPQIQEILSNETPFNPLKYIIKIHTPEKDIDIDAFISLDIERNYLDNISDYIQLAVKLTGGKYFKDIYPYKHNLEISVSTTKEPDKIIRYKAIIIPDGSPLADGADTDWVGKSDLDTSTIVDVHFQLLDRAVEPLRVKTVGGVYKNVLPTDILFSLIDRESKKVLIDGKPSLDSIDITPPDNITPVQQTIIPHGTRLLKLHSFLQNYGTGIYTGGISLYIQHYHDKRRLFVYPPYNYIRYDTETPRAVFYQIPKKRFPNVERTWMMKDNTIHVLVNEGNNALNDGETSMMDTGIGYKTMIASWPMKHYDPSDKIVDVGADDVFGKKDTVTRHYASHDREDSLIFMPLHTPSINLYKYHSEYNRKLGIAVTVPWKNSNYKELYPGMPCKYIFIKNEELLELKGTVIGNHTYVSLNGIPTTMVVLYLERPEYVNP